MNRESPTNNEIVQEIYNNIFQQEGSSHKAAVSSAPRYTEGLLLPHFLSLIILEFYGPLVKNTKNCLKIATLQCIVQNVWPK